MAALSSLTNRIFLSCTLLATLSLGFAFYFVNERVTRASEADLRGGLMHAGTLVDQHRATLTDTYVRFARLVADLPRFKALVETGDAPTIQKVVVEYRKNLNADLLIVTGRDGRVLALEGVATKQMPLPVTPPEHPTAEQYFLWPHERGILQVLSVPIFVGLDQPDVFGRLSVGFLLDDRLAQQFKDVTGSDIGFAARGKVLAATLPASTFARLAGVVNAPGPATVTLDGEEFIAVRRPLGATNDQGSPVVLILRSRTERLVFLRSIRNGLVGALIATVLLATILSYAVARTMTRPLAAVTSAMRDVATTGDLTRKVPLHSRGWDDEDARLLTSTFNTLTDSIGRFQKEAAQRERLSSLGRLSTVVAHEVRNPLMIIRASLGTLRRDHVTGAELREAVADIDEETSRLNRIVTDVLDFAKPVRFDLAETRINTLCRASAQAAEAGETHSVIAFDLDASDPVVTTDAERLRTALVNILTNARHAVDTAARVPAGGGVAVVSEPLISVRTRVEGGRLRIAIVDRGMGMGAEDLAHIFDPYFTTRRAGTGLGLPIARNIVEGLGGTIAVSSRVGEGTDIRIDLPVTPPAPAQTDDRRTT